MAPTRKPAVFLQTGFRSGGTWLWSRFRADPGVLGFYEPLNEALLEMTAEISSGLRPERSGLNHPKMAEPYFKEFISLLNPGGTGVRGYRADFGVKSYFEQDQALAEDIRAYIADLLDYAAALGRQPVLKFTRALARAGWLRATFPDALQILLLRSPVAQFTSGYRQAVAKDNVTFQMIPLWALTQVKDQAVIDLLARLPVPALPPGSDVVSLATAYGQAARHLTMEQSASVFIGFYVLSHWFSKDFADITVEIERLRSDNEYAGSVGRFIAERAGLEIDLSSISSDDERGANVRNGELDIMAFRDVARTTLDALQESYPSSVEYTRRRL